MNLLYRQEKEKILVKTVDKDILPKCETFSRGDFDSLLAQTGCVGIRIYFGMKEDMKICAVVVGVDVNNADMVSTDAINNLIIENGTRCPAHCPPPSPLN